MPSPAAWLGLLDRRLGDRLEAVPRVSFRSDSRSVDHLGSLVADSAHHDGLQAEGADLASRLATMPDPWFDLDGYASPADVAARGIGFAVVDGHEVAGAAWSSLVCSTAIEVSVFVDEGYRRRGVATTVAARLVAGVRSAAASGPAGMRRTRRSSPARHEARLRAGREPASPATCAPDRYSSAGRSNAFPRRCSSR